MKFLSHQMVKMKAFVFLLSVFVLAGNMMPQEIPPKHQPAATELQQNIHYYNAPPDKVEEWRQWKFGLLLQWNPSIVTGAEIGWSRAAKRWGFSYDHPGQYKQGRKRKGMVPVEIYDNAYKRFTAENFNALDMCKIVKDAGMRVISYMAKHHDGFAMWDTQMSDYKITSPECPVGRDLLKEMVEACRTTDLKVSIYFSQPDWYHPDYLRSPEAHARYLKTMHGWIRELLTNYGTIDAIDFDGLDGLARNWNAEAVFKMIRELQPDAVVNNRGGNYDVKGWPIHRWFQVNEDQKEDLEMALGFPGDYDTAESWQGTLSIERMQADRPWLLYTPLQIGQWPYSPRHELRSLEELLQLLVNVVGRDGSLALCVGVKPDGVFDERTLPVLKECGQWLRKYGESIYETRGGPYYPTSFGVTTYSENKIFVHILEWPQDVLVLPPIHRRLVSSSVLTGGTAEVLQEASGAITISVPESYRRKADTIVVLKLDGPAREAKPGRVGRGSLTAGKPVRASNVMSGLTCFSPENAVDDDSHTRWATDFATKQAWLEVDLGREETFNTVLIQEDLNFIRRFEAQYKKTKNDAWTTVLHGEMIGPYFKETFDPVKGRYVRLNILDAIHAPQFPTMLYGLHTRKAAFPGPTIWEFQITHERTTQRAQTSVIRRDESPQRIEADISGARQLYLIVNDAGDGNTDDHAIWANAKLIDKDGKEVWLGDVSPRTVRQGWTPDFNPWSPNANRGNLYVDRPMVGEELRIGNQVFRRGLAVHANSEIIYLLEEQYIRFEAEVGVAGEKVNPSEEKSGSVIFEVLTGE